LRGGFTYQRDEPQALFQKNIAVLKVRQNIQIVWWCETRSGYSDQDDKFYVGPGAHCFRCVHVAGGSGLLPQGLRPKQNGGVTAAVNLCVRTWVVPPGLESFLPVFPALKHWAKLGRPSGAGFSTLSIRAPQPSFFEGWDSTVVSLLGFLAGFTGCAT